ncbi:MAG: bifunctional (p)ppGpp synthetase/guanosine-3',5'-bis(diphosphate) 3'-pyrophosphohydrolase [Solobacterium sp.]|nr:bifunctional (p)ppGpp synthetase/guanosine-3',5'-bis(diphosphate) 3'-pyrophosphohydrolase [Solobacterium sp.]
MIYTDMTKKAIRLIFRAHAGQTDKCGLPYVCHPLHVAESMEDEVTCTAALLHDVVEDTDVTFEDLAEMGFTPEVIRIVRLLTHDPEVPYMDYVRRIKEDPQAAKVKLSDLRHNCDLTRIDHVAQRDLDRVKKYKAAMELLLSKD